MFIIRSFSVHQNPVFQASGGRKRDLKICGNNRGGNEGQEVNRKFQKEFLGMIREVNGTGVNSITENDRDNVSMVEWWMGVTFTDGRRSLMEEVAVKNGRTIR